MAHPYTIAVDGPAGSGKSTICDRLAQEFDYAFVDTGALYRAITVVALENGVSVDDESAVDALLPILNLEIKAVGQGRYCVIANGNDVTDQLRTKAVDSNVSAIAKMPAVRQALLPIQRKIAHETKIILAGRDIGTVVLPDADLKLYIDASLEERARRRYEQYQAEGKPTSHEDQAQALIARDRIDSERANAPLKRANDAIYILTDGLSIEDVIEKIRPHIER